MSMLESLSDLFAQAGLYNRVSVKLGGAAFFDRDDQPVFSYVMRQYPSDGCALLESFIVGENYRGNGQRLGGATIRHMAKHLEHEGIGSLELFRVQGDGLTFWPRMGAVPDNFKRFGLVMTYMHSSLPEGHSDRPKTDEALRLAAVDPAQAWFGMTDGTSGVSRETMRRVSSALLADTSYVFEFDQPEVRKRLSLG